MKTVVSFACVVIFLGASDTRSHAGDGPNPQSAQELPDGVRELTFDIQKCARTKKGASVTICTTREQVEQELGQDVAKAVWAKIDPKKEVAVVLGIWDVLQDPGSDRFAIREVKAEGSTTLRFKYEPRNSQLFNFLIGFEWPTRCKVYAVPRGAAVGLD